MLRFSSPVEAKSKSNFISLINSYKVKSVSTGIYFMEILLFFFTGHIGEVNQTLTCSFFMSSKEMGFCGMLNRKYET